MWNSQIRGHIKFSQTYSDQPWRVDCWKRTLLLFFFKKDSSLDNSRYFLYTESFSVRRQFVPIIMSLWLSQGPYRTYLGRCVCTHKKQTHYIVHICLCTYSNTELFLVRFGLKRKKPSVWCIHEHKWQIVLSWEIVIVAGRINNFFLLWALARLFSFI